MMGDDTNSTLREERMLTSEELQAARDTAMRNKAILDAQLEAVREHRWEHKTDPIAAPISESPSRIRERMGFQGERTFTRSEVLTVLRVLRMQDYSNDPGAIFARIMSTFERME